MFVQAYRANISQTEWNANAGDNAVTPEQGFISFIKPVIECPAALCLTIKLG